MRIGRSFYQQDPEVLAKSLLGKVICINNNHTIRKFRIVETEAYGGITDKAAHSYKDNKTLRTEAMYLDGGHVYVYLIYGMYYMLNIVASYKGIPNAVLIRAVEPLDEDYHGYPTNGPGKLCKYIGIDKSFNKIDLCTSEKIYLINDNFCVKEIVVTKRINIDYAQEDKERLWRFYILGNKFVSKK